MPPVRVVLGFNPGEDRQPGLGLRLPDPAINELTLQRRKEAFRHGVVIGITHRPHAGVHAHFLAAVTKRNAGVLGEFNRSSQHWVVDWIFDIHLRLRLVSSS